MGSIKWVPVCCYIQPVMGKSPVSLVSCASLGLHIVHIPDSHVTHHIAPSYTAQPIIAASLLSAAQFVKLEWLTEVLRLGTLPKDSLEASLEQNFELPALNKYRPTYSPSLPTSQKEIRVWEPNEERLTMLSSFRFLYVDEKSRIGDYKEVIERGGGSFETFDATTGKLKFHRALTRGQAKEGKTQIVVGKAKSIIAAIGKEAWRELVEEAKSRVPVPYLPFGLHIIDPELIVQVVIEVDTSLFSTPPSPDLDNDELPQSTSLPDFIPNTHSEEPSIPPPEPEQTIERPKRLVRRATSRQASQEPSAVLASKTPEPDPETEAPPPPRKKLTRRVKASGMPLVIGFDDPSMILDVSPDLSAITPAPATAPPPPSAEEPQPQTQAPRSSRLKRRVAVTSESGGSQAVGFGYTLDEPVVEPPLKKFKALFEASGQETTGSGTFDGSTYSDQTQSIPDRDSSSQTQNESQTQSGGKGRVRRTGTANLSTLREEEEETQGSLAAARGTKRGLEDINEDVEMGYAVSQAVTAPSLPKKRAIESVNAVEKGISNAATSTAHVSSKPPSSTPKKPPASQKGGAAPGKPDQDTTFLKAIASTKKGKKAEDDFDRDFNKLKITKPALEREDPEQQWALVADFGGDKNIRGNFMVVVEMPVYRRDRTDDDDMQRWDGQENHKKFKKKADTVRSERRKVEVFASDNDYGTGPSYWRDGKSQEELRDSFGPSQPKVHVKAKGKTPTQTQTNGRSQAPMVIDDSDDEIAPIRKGKTKASASSRASSAIPPKRTARSKAPAQSQPLFLDDDDDDEIQSFDNDEDDMPEASDEEQTLRSTRTRSTQRPTARGPAKKPTPAPILVDDDSDDGAVFKGFKGKTRKR
ncbi:hypothetical protein H0H87_010563 [Tephrocybe sp. NHM501043]|nr:hypothetical protein H0H87_010563 [Tephrocybe sp. NHM501043]